MGALTLSLWGVFGLFLLTFSILEINAGFVMSTYKVKTSGILAPAHDKHQEIRCGMRCNLDDSCQGYMMSSSEQDPCSFIYENSVDVEVGSNEAYYKLEAASQGELTESFP